MPGERGRVRAAGPGAGTEESDAGLRAQVLRHAPSLPGAADSGCGPGPKPGGGPPPFRC
ncbi:hypothetical protein BN2537_12623 [Streptomyces venezuelae]|nr:hypothetical protein BN2537_12623 [Streptomyces venezuelae]